jgi:hypothetical protein
MALNSSLEEVIAEYFFFHKWKDGVYTNSLKSIQEIKMAGFFAINSQFLRNPISTCSFGN